MKVRLQKLISGAGIASRRAAEEMILTGRVCVNGETATLGMAADPELDTVTVDGAPAGLGRKPEALPGGQTGSEQRGAADNDR